MGAPSEAGGAGLVFLPRRRALLFMLVIQPFPGEQQNHFFFPQNSVTPGCSCSNAGSRAVPAPHPAGCRRMVQKRRLFGAWQSKAAESMRCLSPLAFSVCSPAILAVTVRIREEGALGASLSVAACRKGRRRDGPWRMHPPQLPVVVGAGVGGPRDKALPWDLTRLGSSSAALRPAFMFSHPFPNVK